MANRSKARGTAFETDLIRYLQSHGFPEAERRALAGVLDKGDVAGVPGVVIECKNHREMDLAGWMDEAQREAINAGVYRYVVVHKRRQKGIKDCYASMPVWLLVDLLRRVSAVPEENVA